jgi:hypothetical protein
MGTLRKARTCSNMHRDAESGAKVIRLEEIQCDITSQLFDAVRTWW